MSQGANKLSLDAAIPGLEDLDGVFSLSVGVMDGATNVETGAQVAEYAIYNEFGTKRIPARPAMRATLDANADRYVDGLGNMLISGTDPETALDTLAQVVEGDIKRNIAEWQSPPNAPATVARKGFNAPLKETGAYEQAITSRVDKE